MKIECCGRVFSTSGESYLYIDRYNLSPFLIPEFQGKKTAKQILYTALCPNCGNMICALVSYVKNARGKLSLADKITFRGKSGEEFFKNNFSKLTPAPLKTPFFKTYGAKTIPFIYGARIDGITQRPRYVDESGFVGNEIKSEVVYKKSI